MSSMERVVYLASFVPANRVCWIITEPPWGRSRANAVQYMGQEFLICYNIGQTQGNKHIIHIGRGVTSDEVFDPKVQVKSQTNRVH